MCAACKAGFSHSRRAKHSGGRLCPEKRKPGSQSLRPTSLHLLHRTRQRGCQSRLRGLQSKCSPGRTCSEPIADSLTNVAEFSFGDKFCVALVRVAALLHKPRLGRPDPNPGRSYATAIVTGRPNSLNRCNIWRRQHRSDVLRSHRFQSGLDLEQTRMRYVALYNHQLPQSALKSRTPIQAMKVWYAERPDLFVKRPYDHPGCDT